MSVLGRDPHEFGYCAPKWTPTLLQRYLCHMLSISACRRSVSLALRRLEQQGLLPYSTVCTPLSPPALAAAHAPLAD
jgi:hypothetical protein